MAKPYIRRKIQKPNPVQVGFRFGRLLIISDGWEQVGATGYVSDMVQVRCDCGVEKFVRPSSLVRKHVQSCGCLQREAAAATGSVANLKHGDGGNGATRAPEYGVYRTMLSRCENPRTEKFADYGGRGIVVCDAWRGDGGYEQFLADMGRRPAGGSVERKDTNGPYSPANCRWASSVEQANNRRSNRLISFEGRCMSVTQWARQTGLKASTVTDRLNRGWPVEKALSATPV